jgi:hypothetical protein
MKFRPKIKLKKNLKELLKKKRKNRWIKKKLFQAYSRILGWSKSIYNP